MDRCEACPLLEGKRPIQEGCNGGLPVSVCIAQLQHNILKLEKRQKIWCKGSDDHELGSSKGSTA